MGARTSLRLARAAYRADRLRASGGGGRGLGQTRAAGTAQPTDAASRASTEMPVSGRAALAQLGRYTLRESNRDRDTAGRQPDAPARTARADRSCLCFR